MHAKGEAVSRAQPCRVRCMGSSSWAVEPADEAQRCDSMRMALRHIEREIRSAMRCGCHDLRFWIYLGNDDLDESSYPDYEVHAGPRGGLMLEHC